MMTTRKGLANAIVAMNYGDLKSVGASLASMKDAEVRPKIETDDEYASLLFDWAAAEVEDE
jgi:hypothetical protein